MGRCHGREIRRPLELRQKRVPLLLRTLPSLPADEGLPNPLLHLVQGGDRRFDPFGYIHEVQRFRSRDDGPYLTRLQGKGRTVEIFHVADLVKGLPGAEQPRLRQLDAALRGDIRQRRAVQDPFAVFLRRPRGLGAAAFERESVDDLLPHLFELHDLVLLPLHRLQKVQAEGALEDVGHFALLEREQCGIEGRQ